MLKYCNKLAVDVQTKRVDTSRGYNCCSTILITTYESPSVQIFANPPNCFAQISPYFNAKVSASKTEAKPKGICNSKFHLAFAIPNNESSSWSSITIYNTIKVNFPNYFKFKL